MEVISGVMEGKSQKGGFTRNAGGTEMEQTQPTNNFKAVVTVLNKRGLHMRLAGELVTVSNGFNSEILISKGRRSANAKSVLDLVSLSAAPGSHLNVSTTGSDAKAALDAITNFFVTYSGDN